MPRPDHDHNIPPMPVWSESQALTATEEKHVAYVPDDFEYKLRELINAESIDSSCNIPDYVISRYLANSLKNLVEVTSDNKNHE